MREVVLDTETTGRDPKEGHRVVEIGCVELINHLPTGADGGSFHCYINPERDMPIEAERVHGLSREFLIDKPIFSAIVDDFLAFIGDSPLVIHNAAFDMGFLNAELERHGRPTLSGTRAVDTLAMARRRFPGAQASLDALCRRYGIDLSARTQHGALLDAELLAEVYLELRGGRQPGLVLPNQQVDDRSARPMDKRVRPPRPHRPLPDELAAHEQFLDKLTSPLWRA